MKVTLTRQMSIGNVAFRSKNNKCAAGVVDIMRLTRAHYFRDKSISLVETYRKD